MIDVLLILLVSNVSHQTVLYFQLIGPVGVKQTFIQFVCQSELEIFSFCIVNGIRSTFDILIQTLSSLISRLDDCFTFVISIVNGLINTTSTWVELIECYLKQMNLAALIMILEMEL